MRDEGFDAFKKYYLLVGKNISYEEYQVIPSTPSTSSVGSQQNAVRHVYWQCLLKKRLGEEFAVAMGEAHELGRPGSDADNRADEINNRIGLQLADDVKSEDDCLQRAREMWTAVCDRRVLRWWLIREGSRAPSFRHRNIRAVVTGRADQHGRRRHETPHGTDRRSPVCRVQACREPACPVGRVGRMLTGSTRRVRAAPATSRRGSPGGCRGRSPSGRGR
ncbi:DUF6973 domain-containing protein [Streptomyces sp. NPDC127077]|uniref:TilS substrate-binding domain-containing protein n=1 Tax=Streptomyces sp. NPDC127077 TaxID=3347131 RepID=UPI00364B2AD5